MMTAKMISNYAKAVDFGRAFYASDLELNGGAINALQRHGLIKETGETRTLYVDLFDDWAKKVTVKQWVVNPKAAQRVLKNARKALDEAQFVINALEALA